MYSGSSKEFGDGIFSISLDFELHWGRFDKMPLNKAAKQYFLNTREIIPYKLKLFEDNGIHVTWATVGMLFNKNAAEWKLNQPKQLPTFADEKLSAYNWVNQNGFDGEEDVFHFAPSLIDKIQQTSHQEIGTHTYAHYYCLAEGQTTEQFRQDLKMAAKLAAAKGINLQSLVFPRNQFNAAYLSVCTEMGITSVRSNPDVWYWRPASESGILTKIFRTGDAYFNLKPVKTVALNKIVYKGDEPLQIPASRLYRAWRPGSPFMNKRKLHRILNEMTEAAQYKRYYHLWWHPHNFGNHPQECLNELKIILQHFITLNRQYGFRSMTMNETAEFYQSIYNN